MKFKKTYKRILVLPDIHAPWVDWTALKQVKKWHDTHKPDLVIQLGDLTDQKIWSRWQADTDDVSPCQEFLETEETLGKIHKWFPKMIILRGNHDERVKSRAIESGIPSRMFKDVDEVFNYKGWTWWSRTERLRVNTPKGEVLFMHGDEMGGTPVQKSRLLGVSVVTGHTHKVTLGYTQTDKHHIFGMDMGCLMDINSKAARYAQSNPISASIGFGVIEKGVPYFVPCGS